MASNTPATVDDYVSQFPPNVQEIMQKLRAVIKDSAPGVTEKISYGIVGYYLNGILLSFGGFKDYIGMYPVSDGMKALQGVTIHKGTRSSLHFPYSNPMPYDLIREIVIIRVAEKTKPS